MASFGNWSAACSLAVQVPLQQQNEKLYALSGMTIFAFGVSAAASCVVFRLWLRLDHEAKASIWLLYVPHLPSSDYHVLSNPLQLWLVPWSHVYRQLRGFVVLGLQRAFPRLLFRIFQPSNLRRSLLSQSLSHRRAAETNHIWALARLFSRRVRLRPQRPPARRWCSYTPAETSTRWWWARRLFLRRRRSATLACTAPR